MKTMRIAFLVLVVLLMFANNISADVSDEYSPYPIVFVHGFNSDENAWVYNVKTEKMYEGEDNLVYTTTVTVTSRQLNVGLTESDFQ